MWSVRFENQLQKHDMGSRGGGVVHPAHILPKIEKKTNVGVKSWFFTRNTPQNNLSAPP